MIVRKRILEKYENYKFNIPYHSGDKVLVLNGENLKEGTKILEKNGSSIKYSFYLPDQIDIEKSKLKEYINCIDGEFVNKGDILAERVVGGGLRVKKLVSPSQGVVDLSRLNKGFLDLLGEENSVLVESNFKGVIEEINPVNGIGISADSFALDLLSISDSSSEKERKVTGEFVVLGEGNDLLLETVDSDYEGKIVFVGKYLHPKLLHDLFEKGALFVLTYSMDYEDFRKQGLPVGIIGGFGEIYSSKSIIDLIASMKSKFAIVDYDEKQIFFVTGDSTYRNKENLFVKSLVGSAVISRALFNYGMLGKIVSVEEEDLYVKVEWEGGQESMINIGAVEFVSF